MHNQNYTTIENMVFFSSTDLVEKKHLSNEVMLLELVLQCLYFARDRHEPTTVQKCYKIVKNVNFL